jgi:PPM family protein phosphatase
MTNPASATPPPEPQGEIVVSVFGRTDVGRTREHNEDAFVVADLTTDNATLQPEVRQHVLGPKGTLFMVADGMGGAAAGEIASAMAVEVVLSELRTHWINQPSNSADAFVRGLKRATASANQHINSFAASHPEYRGMGTTATIAVLLGDTLYLSQVGDSRAYLVRGGVARQITKDQSLMQKLIEAGELTEEEAAQSERRNIILQALGPETSIKTDLTHQTIRRGDTLVLCSDGLSGQVTKDDIGRVITEEPDLFAACKRLIDHANENGGPDNITVIAARFEGAGLRPPDTDDEVGHRAFPLAETGQTPAAQITGLTVPSDQRITQPVVAAPYPAEPMPPAGSTARAPTVLEGPTDEHPVIGTPPRTDGVIAVSTSRRQKGMVIAVTLLVILLAGVAWFAIQTWFVLRTKPSETPPVATPTVAPAPAAADSARDSTQRAVPAVDSLRTDTTRRADSLRADTTRRVDSTRRPTATPPATDTARASRPPAP